MVARNAAETKQELTRGKIGLCRTTFCITEQNSPNEHSTTMGKTNSTCLSSTFDNACGYCFSDAVDERRCWHGRQSEGMSYALRDAAGDGSSGRRKTVRSVRDDTAESFCGCPRFSIVRLARVLAGTCVCFVGRRSFFPCRAVRPI